MSSSTRKVTVEDANSSPSPSPPPASNSTSTSKSRSKSRSKDESEGSAKPSDQPINSLGVDDEEEEEEEEVWDPSVERLPGDVDDTGKGKGKGKGKAKAKDVEGEEEQAHPWQAVWSPEQSAWYFWNTKSGEVSWTNPLEDGNDTSSINDAPPLPNEPVPQLPTQQSPYPSSTSASTSGAGGAGTFGGIPEIDPALAFLLSPAARAGLASGQGGDGVQHAAFNARTGQFTPSDHTYNVDHLDEYNRAKRMNSHYFDVEAWEQERAEENAKRKREEELGIGGKKKITKKDMERFRKKAQEKKMRSQAWLRE
ncbi:hypothetical protein IAR55_003440 [Kwoniella newhampshirensis]|uniref:WW domain-containing protein n=1 Tax=Kwoniella newhampshirensis TaxID=1651941 RepID=A0AAW0YZ28_9TREE